ncbi:16S rRNA (uracil(1498)-N(3))-methyltransferase [Treponema sp. OMZ 840]|uniref:16S rRNA (uracil(1498)-N(3))-methyltransferase n=1 Tax=Treponema sp. OMZ 840 TaxID=244313 RepID=UPI003D8CAA3F
MNIVLFCKRDNYFFPLNDERTRHICRILKKKEGDTFEAGIEGGMAGKARIVSLNDAGLSFDFTPLSDGKPLFPLEMIVGFPRPIQLKRLFRDMAGLGVSRILLCGTETGEKSYMESKIVERGAAYEALKDGSIQAKSTHIPKLDIFASVKDCLASLNAEKHAAGRISVCLDNVKAGMPLGKYIKNGLGTRDGFARSCVPNGKDCPSILVRAAIGSERGWSDAEREAFRSAGFELCSMGSRVLRTETAATVSASIILEALGVL